MAEHFPFSEESRWRQDAVRCGRSLDAFDMPKTSVTESVGFRRSAPGEGPVGSRNLVSVCFAAAAAVGCPQTDHHRQ